jgi:hypothetical protein
VRAADPVGVYGIYSFSTTIYMGHNMAALIIIIGALIVSRTLEASYRVVLSRTPRFVKPASYCIVIITPLLFNFFAWYHTQSVDPIYNPNGVLIWLFCVEVSYSVALNVGMIRMRGVFTDDVRTTSQEASLSSARSGSSTVVAAVDRLNRLRWAVTVISVILATVQLYIIYLIFRDREDFLPPDPDTFDGSETFYFLIELAYLISVAWYTWQPPSIPASEKSRTGVRLATTPTESQDNVVSERFQFPSTADRLDTEADRLESNTIESNTIDSNTELNVV